MSKRVYCNVHGVPLEGRYCVVCGAKRSDGGATADAYYAWRTRKYVMKHVYTPPGLTPPLSDAQCMAMWLHHTALENDPEEGVRINNAAPVAAWPYMVDKVTKSHASDAKRYMMQVSRKDVT